MLMAHQVLFYSKGSMKKIEAMVADAGVKVKLGRKLPVCSQS